MKTTHNNHGSTSKLTKILTTIFAVSAFFIFGNIVHAQFQGTCQGTPIEGTNNKETEFSVSVTKQVNNNGQEQDPVVKNGSVTITFIGDYVNVVLSGIGGSTAQQAKIDLESMNADDKKTILKELYEEYLNNSIYKSFRDTAKEKCGNDCFGNDNLDDVYFLKKNESTTFKIEFLSKKLDNKNLEKFINELKISATIKVPVICAVKNCNDFTYQTCPTAKGCKVTTANTCVDASGTSDSGGDFLTNLKTTQRKTSLYKDQTNVSSTATIDTIANIIERVLQFLGVVLMLLIMYSGYLWLTAMGNKDKITKAKTIVVNGIVGIVIVSAAYSITAFVTSRIKSATETGDTESVGCEKYENTQCKNKPECLWNTTTNKCEDINK